MQKSCKAYRMKILFFRTEDIHEYLTTCVGVICAHMVDFLQAWSYISIIVLLALILGFAFASDLCTIKNNDITLIA